MSELKPCPFCGGKAYLANVAMAGCAYVVCTDCRMQSDDGSQDRVIAAWNTRADTIPSPDALIIAALEAAADNAESPNLPVFKPGWGSAQDAAAISAMVAVAKFIRALADNPDALAAIKAKAEGRG